MNAGKMQMAPQRARNRGSEFSKRRVIGRIPWMQAIKNVLMRMRIAPDPATAGDISEHYFIFLAPNMNGALN